MKHTPETHPEYSNLREVLERLKQVTDFIDQSARRAENHRFSISSLSFSILSVHIYYGHSD